MFECDELTEVDDVTDRVSIQIFSMESFQHYPYVVVGGGIAGVSCTETISLLSTSNALLITVSRLVKTVINYKQISKVIEDFDVEEKPTVYLEQLCKNVTVLQSEVVGLDTDKKTITTNTGCKFTYDRLCICTGGKPKVLISTSPYVLGIRDTETVKIFQDRLSTARRIVIVGNGGIATEMVYEIEGCDIIWAIKDNSISQAFVDAGAAEFFLAQLSVDKVPDDGPVKRHKYTLESDTTHSASTSAATSSNVTSSNCCLGNALGPDWSSGLCLKGKTQKSHSIHVENKVEVIEIVHSDQYKLQNLSEDTIDMFSASNSINDWPVYVKLSNGHLYGCDFIVSATGVIPNTDIIENNKQFTLSSDGGVSVNEFMQTSVDGVWAAGDVCTATWEPAEHWLQMRLWTQARQMGAYAAKAMVSDCAGELTHLTQDFCFELFAHSTKFFNYKVILLGKFNAQGLADGDYELLLRVTEGEEYIKVVLRNGRMYGAILIGETDMEETFENLILNEIDLTDLKDHLLEPGIDIDDYFD